jgi:hypothetical protein
VEGTDLAASIVEQFVGSLRIPVKADRHSV